MTKPTYYVDNMVLSFYAGGRKADAVTIAARMFFALARSRGRLVGSSLLVKEALAGAPSAARERQTALRLVQIFEETQQMRNLAAKYAVEFPGRRSDDPDLRHYAAATIKRVAFFVSEDQFFKDAKTVVRLASYNERHRLPVPNIMSCNAALAALNEHLRNNPPRLLFIEESHPKWSKSEKALYRRVKAERRVWLREERRQEAAKNKARR